MYKAYLETLQQRLDIADNIEDADVVLFLGAWSCQGFRLAQRSRKMGIPYIVCPLGDISERNCHNPGMKRSLQTLIYQKTMCKSAELIIATTPLEKEYLTALGWNSHISLIRYFGYSQLTSQSAMTEDWQGADTITFTNYEKRKAEAIAAKTDEPIIAQIMQIKAGCRTVTFRRNTSTTCTPCSMPTTTTRMPSMPNSPSRNLTCMQLPSLMP